ncbi:MAG: DUF1464 domain-containing protein [Acidobacteria bacterium]|nr:MAG: DUF1464 domain-containing protein [Acidobacteriota bacterium]
MHHPPLWTQRSRARRGDDRRDRSRSPDASRLKGISARQGPRTLDGRSTKDQEPVDVCGLDEGRLFLDRSLPTSEALAEPSALVALLDEAHRTAPLDLVAGPSGYGLPLTAARDLTDTDLRLAYLAAEGESGGIGGLRSLMRRLARSSTPVVLTPGVVHLPSVPAQRKVNRVDMGTADKVCAVALAVRDQTERRRCSERDVSFILLEMGGAFTAAIAVEHGRIVDGVGGTCGPLGVRAAGALDGEVAFLAGTVPKQLLFRGGAATIAGEPDALAEAIAAPTTLRGQLAWDAYVESSVKAAAALAVSVPRAFEVILSGRMARVAGVREELTRRLAGVIAGRPVHVLTGFAVAAKQGAQGAALIADGLAGGASAALVDALGIREACGTVLDHLYVITPAAARARLGIA